MADPETAALKIQKYWREYAVRMPKILCAIQRYLIKRPITISTQDRDGRHNSANDERTIIDALRDRFPGEIREAPPRWWYDVSANHRGTWIPINIKVTSMRGADNVGNLAMCVQAYTDIDVPLDRCHMSGEMSQKLEETVYSHAHYNRNRSKDYYFLVVDKNDPCHVIINSILRLNKLTPNASNLPFQICWKDNTTYKYRSICDCIEEFRNLYVGYDLIRNWQYRLLSVASRRPVT